MEYSSSNHMVDVNGLSNSDLVSLCLTLQQDKIHLVREISDLRLAKEAVEQSALGLIDADACDQHGKMIRALPFGEFLELHRQMGCRYCMHEAIISSRDSFKT